MTDFDWMKERDALCGRPGSDSVLDSKDKRIAELEAEINHLEQNFTEWLKEYRKRGDRIAELERQLACSIVNGNDAREQCLEHVYALSEASARIAGLEKELAAERTVIAFAPRGWHD